MKQNKNQLLFWVSYVRKGEGIIKTRDSRYKKSKENNLQSSIAESGGDSL
jgi:hypothetical protein